ncbi:MAG: beta strand repeat-containing protein, partial [Phycisphaerales bacterium]
MKTTTRLAASVLRSPRAVVALAGLAATCALAPLAAAQQQFPMFIGPVNGNYSTPGNWSGGIVPNNGNGGFTFGPLFPIGVSCTSSNSPTVDKFQLDLGALLRISDSTNFTIIGDQGVMGITGLMSCRGTILLNSAGNATDFRINGGTATFGGSLAEPGVFMGSNTQANRVYGIIGTERLVNGVGGTIAGSMQIGLNFLAITNLGEIRASTSGGITIDSNALGNINTGTLSADGGTLTLSTGTYDSAGGFLAARNSSTLTLVNSVRIDDGTLTTVNNGLITLGSGAILAGCTTSGQVRLNDNNHAFLEASHTISAGGTFTLNSGGNPTDLRISGNTIINGPGLFTTSNTTANRVYGNAGDETLTFSGGLTVSGSAQLGVNFLNFIALPGTTVSAAQTGGMVIDPAAGGYLNRGVLRAQNGAVLTLQNGGFDNNGAEGLIVAEDASRVDITGSAVMGGTIDRNGTGLVRLLGSSILANTVNTGLVQLPDNNLAFLSGTHTNSTLSGEGILTMGSAGNATDLRISGDVTVTGNGAITSSNTQANRVYADGGAARLTNAASHTIRGSMQLGFNSMSMTNNGLVLADLSGGLTIDMNPQGMINTGILRASSPGTLAITGSTVITNTGGTIDSPAGGVVQLTGASRIIGGSITGLGTVLILGGAALENVSNSATITQSDNNAAFITTTLNNAGTYRLNSAGNSTDLQIQSDVLIQGAGSITSSNTPANRIYAQGGTGRLTNAAGHTIRGSMQLGTDGMAMTNNGLVLADLSGGLTIDMNNAGMINTATLRAGSTGTLTI